MANRDVQGQVQALLDRQAILDCIHRYCRGVDRFDRDLILSAYHPDAVDHHGEFQGSPEQFVKWVFYYHGQYQLSHQHLVLNHSVELDADTAHAETYWMCVSANKTGDPLTMSGGRYVDRFECRDGRWGIATRVCIHEWRTRLDALAPSSVVDAFVKGRRDAGDLSYERPLSGPQRSD